MASIHNFYVGKRYQLHTGGRDGIEAGQQAGSQLGERETLITVSEVIASGEQVVGIEVVVNLGNHAVHAILERSSSGKIVAGGAAGLELGPNDGIQGIVKNGNVRRRPRIACQQCGGDHI